MRIFYESRFGSACMACLCLIFIPAVAVPVAPDGMVLVKGGTFIMGNSLDEAAGQANELPLHRVELAPFWMGKYEVTWALWKWVYDWALKNGYQFDNPGTMGSPLEGQGDLSKDEDAPEPTRTFSGSHPVTTVSWYDAVKWCNAYSEMQKRTPCYYTGSAFRTVFRIGKKDLRPAFVKWDANGFRLPTEAEWEYAAKGGHLVVGAGRKPRIYAGSDDPDTVAWYGNNSGNRPHPVGTKHANVLGIFDMSGNVWEWCYDWYGEAYYKNGAMKNPRGAAFGQYRILRGGSFDHFNDVLRAAFRNLFLYGEGPANGGRTFGFRLVVSASR